MQKDGKYEINKKIGQKSRKHVVFDLFFMQNHFVKIFQVVNRKIEIFEKSSLLQLEIAFSLFMRYNTFFKSFLKPLKWLFYVVLILKRY
nr:MAG TPA: hypothetical protein [Caudoviricetes sp.]